MAITARQTAPAPAHAQTTTRGQVEVAARYFGKAFGWEQEKVRGLFDFAILSVATARAMVEYAILLARSQVAETKLSIPISDRRRLELAQKPLLDLKAALEKAYQFDVAAGRGRHLRGIPFGKKLNFSIPERQVVVARLKEGFAPPAGTPVEEELYQTIVGDQGMSLLLADFIIRQFLNEAETAEYVTDLKAARAQAAGSPAPEADAIDESNEDSDVAEVEAEEPAAEAVSA